MPRKIRDLLIELKAAGWFLVKAGKGSHHKYAHNKTGRKLIISGKSGDDALDYQEKLVRQAINEVKHDL